MCDLSHDTRDFGFYTNSLVETDRYIKVADGHLITSKQTGKFQIEKREEN